MRPTRLALLLSALAVGCPGCGSSHTNGTGASRGSSSAKVLDLSKEQRRSVPTSSSTATGPPANPRIVPNPRIVQDPIPFGARRKAETRSYAQRHYGLDTYRLTDPHVIVIHYTETPDFQSVYGLFAPDAPDQELHELPNICAHFVIDKQGTIHQLVPLSLMCRHTVGLNWTAIGIEHIGYTDAEILGNPRQSQSSLRLVRWLRCRFHIEIKNVIGHNESLSSPYHRENVAALRTQTHPDFKHADMEVYRQRLRDAGPC